MKKSLKNPIIFLLALTALLSFSLTAFAGGNYVHDPMENPKAAADIIVDPNAVYGYSPNPESPRLGVYADEDWSDAAFVEEMRRQRVEYHDSVKELYNMKSEMEAEGKSVEDIARAVSTRRSEIRMEAHKDDPVGLEKLKQSNLESFGNENGGTPDYFYAKYGSWETVIEKAFSTNAGADACLGLYDLYYDTYIFDGKTVQPTTAQETTEAVIRAMSSTVDSSMRSPQTGDSPTAMIWLIFVSASVMAICAAALKKNRES